MTRARKHLAASAAAEPNPAPSHPGEWVLFSAVFDRGSPVPLYQQLKYHLIHAISTGRLPVGARLPSVRRVSRQLLISPATVQRTYAELQSEGHLSGEAGRGVFVATLDPRHTAPGPAGRATALRDALLPAVLHARAAGFSAAEIATAVRLLADGQIHDEGRARVLFIGARQDSVDKYVPLLRSGLVRTPVEVTGLPLPTVARDGVGALDALLPVDLIVSLVSTLAKARALGKDRDIPVYGLMVELSEETKRTLISLPDEARVGLIGEREFLSNTRSLVEQIRGHQGGIISTSDTDSAALRRVMKGRDVVLHTLGTTTAARAAAPAGAVCIELTFLPMPASMAHLAETVEGLATRGSEPRPSSGLLVGAAGG